VDQVSVNVEKSISRTRVDDVIVKDLVVEGSRSRSRDGHVDYWSASPLPTALGDKRTHLCFSFGGSEILDGLRSYVWSSQVKLEVDGSK